MSWFKKKKEPDTNKTDDAIERLCKVLKDKDKILEDYMSLVTDMSNSNKELVTQVDQLQQMFLVQNERIIRKLQEITSYDEPEIVKEKLEEFIDTLEGKAPADTLLH